MIILRIQCFLKHTKQWLRFSRKMVKIKQRMRNLFELVPGACDIIIVSKVIFFNKYCVIIISSGAKSSILNIEFNFIDI